MNNKGSEVAEKWYQGLDDKKASSIKENYGLEWERLSKIAKLLIYNDCKNYFEDDEDYLTWERRLKKGLFMAIISISVLRKNK